MDLKDYYGKTSCEAEQKRIDALAEKFKQRENAAPDYIFSSPGRAEILGNHTDHNHGLVIVAAISCDILAAVKKTDDGIVRIVSEGFPDMKVDLKDTAERPEEKSTSTALIKGVANALIAKNRLIGGFTAHITSNVFKGAGVSSSAAFEVLIAEIFNFLYLDGKLSPIEKAVISQYSENVYFGKPCGLLDQTGIALGGLSELDFFVPEDPVIKQLGSIKGYSLVITNMGGDHASLTPHYAAIRKEMNAVAAHFGKAVLRDVPYEKFISDVPTLKKKFTDRAILRALHFYEENERVESAAKAILSGDNAKFLEAVEKSGLSSLDKLQNCYVPGEERQPVVLGIELSRRIIKDGAVRVHGGGFAGSILAVVSDKEAGAYAAQMKKWFGDKNVFRALVRSKGTAVIS
ncbi:MAG: galactokinase [Clostridia bacterium]|nr:galactokinase [Clostridia bacterium]